jgi:hypothetical protein
MSNNIHEKRFTMPPYFLAFSLDWARTGLETLSQTNPSFLSPVQGRADQIFFSAGVSRHP